MMFADEPALVLSAAGAIIEALIVLAISFGAPITNDQKLACNTFVTLVVTLGTGILIRSQVTPTAHVVASVKDDAVVVAPPAPPVVLPPVPPAAA